jgi:hypothetical protein
VWGGAIGWPASLGKPAAKQLSAIAGLHSPLAMTVAVFGALLLGLMLPALRLPVQVPVAAAVTVLTRWMLAAGLWCWRGR